MKEKKKDRNITLTNREIIEILIKGIKRKTVTKNNSQG